MPYTQRLATKQDLKFLAKLWKTFAEQRTQVNPSLVLKPNYNFERYIANHLEKPLSFFYVLEHYDSNNSPEKTTVGFLNIYFFDESPAPDLPKHMAEFQEAANPFQPRRVGTSLGLYVEENHRQPEAIKLLVDTGIKKAEELKVTDINLLIGSDQKGIYALLKKLGFSHTGIQLTKRYDINENNLPSLHPPRQKLENLEQPTPDSIPLKDPRTNDYVRNSKGDIVFLKPLTDKTGKFYQDSRGLTVYGLPIRHPETKDWVFDDEDNLVLCPPLLNEKNEIVEYQGSPQFYPPIFENVSGKLIPKKDEKGNYLFADVERDRNGNMIKTPSGKPLFKSQII